MAVMNVKDKNAVGYVVTAKRSRLAWRFVYVRRSATEKTVISFRKTRFYCIKTKSLGYVVRLLVRKSNFYQRVSSFGFGLKNKQVAYTLTRSNAKRKEGLQVNGIYKLCPLVDDRKFITFSCKVIRFDWCRFLFDFRKKYPVFYLQKTRKCFRKQLLDQPISLLQVKERGKWLFYAWL